MTASIASRLRRNLLRLALFAGAFALGGSLSPSAEVAVTCDRFASTSGTTANYPTGGTSGNPWTLTKLLQTLDAGQTGCLGAGTYSAGSAFSNLKTGTSDAARVTVTTKPGDARATVSVPNIYIPAGKNFITLENLKIVGTGPAVTLQLYGDNLTLRNNEVTNNHNGESCILISDTRAPSPVG